MSTPITIDIWSDIQCPWCYIGKRRLEAAVEKFSGDVAITYHSYELSPDTPVGYVGSTVDYLADRKGMPRDQVHQMLDHVTQTAAGDGLEYHLETAPQINTRKAHELLHFALEHGKQAEMKERLLRAHFTENKHTGEHAVLADLAAEVGLDRDLALAALNDGTYAAAVEADINQARAFGIQGVPFFVIDGKYGVSGAQPAEAFLQALEQVAAEKAQA